MEFLLDTANVEEIQLYNDIICISGVTSNPSIVKKSGRTDFFKQMNEIRQVIGKDKSLHIQTVATDKAGIIKDARKIIKNVDKDVYIKIPVDIEGLKAIKWLKAEGFNITATGVYTKFQAYLAVAAGADYIAPYFNRMENQNIDPDEAIGAISSVIKQTNSDSKILAASFKNSGQVNRAIEKGAHAVTIDPSIIKDALEFPSIKKAVNDFTKDWESIFGDGHIVSDLE